MTLHQTRSDSCVSDLQIDRWIADELDAAASARVGDHINGCARCEARVQDIRRAEAVFGNVLPREIALHAGAPRRVVLFQRWATRAGGVLALAAAVLLVVRASHRPDEVAGAVEERTKGVSHVAFYVMHDGSVREGKDGERVSPADAIEFAYTTREPSYLAILSVDGAKHASVYFADNGSAARIEPGGDVSLPQSTVLDATLGEEAIYALFCTSAIPVEPLRIALEADPGRPPNLGSCKVERHTFIKVAR